MVTVYSNFTLLDLRFTIYDRFVGVRVCMFARVAFYRIPHLCRCSCTLISPAHTSDKRMRSRFNEIFVHRNVKVKGCDKQKHSNRLDLLCFSTTSIKVKKLYSLCLFCFWLLIPSSAFTFHD